MDRIAEAGRAYVHAEKTYVDATTCSVFLGHAEGFIWAGDAFGLFTREQGYDQYETAKMLAQ